LQCAMLAEDSNANEALIVAALLHDVGHLLTGQDLPETDGVDLDDDHESVGAEWLSRYFDASVVDPIRLHVAAKRYLCTTEPGYAEELSPTSHRSFIDQGGLMDPEEIAAFEAEPYYEAGVRLRRWDDLAKDPDMPIKALANYEAVFERVRRAVSA